MIEKESISSENDWAVFGELAAAEVVFVRGLMGLLKLPQEDMPRVGKKTIGRIS